jgi:hypothetical protein
MRCPGRVRRVRPHSAAGCGEPGMNLGHEVLAWLGVSAARASPRSRGRSMASNANGRPEYFSVLAVRPVTTRKTDRASRVRCRM